jgi:hypothetical protein
MRQNHKINGLSKVFDVEDKGEVTLTGAAVGLVVENGSVSTEEVCLAAV